MDINMQKISVTRILLIPDTAAVSVSKADTAFPLLRPVRPYNVTVPTVKYLCTLSKTDVIRILPLKFPWTLWPQKCSLGHT